MDVYSWPTLTGTKHTSCWRRRDFGTKYTTRSTRGPRCAAGVKMLASEQASVPHDPKSRDTCSEKPGFSAAETLREIE